MKCILRKEWFEFAKYFWKKGMHLTVTHPPQHRRGTQPDVQRRSRPQRVKIVGRARGSCRRSFQKTFYFSSEQNVPTISNHDLHFADSCGLCPRTTPPTSTDAWWTRSTSWLQSVDGRMIQLRRVRSQFGMKLWFFQSKKKRDERNEIHKLPHMGVAVGVHIF